MTVVYVKRIGSVLAPASEHAEEFVRSLPRDKIVKCQIVQERSAKANSFLWALAHKISVVMVAMGKEEATARWVVNRLLVVTGHYDIVPLSPQLREATGHSLGVQVTRIDFDSMTEAEFRNALKMMTAFILTDLLPHMPTGELTREIEKMCVQQGIHHSDRGDER